MVILFAHILKCFLAPKNSEVEYYIDCEDCFVDVTQFNNSTGNSTTWSFCIDFGSDIVYMLEPFESEPERFNSDYNAFSIIQTMLKGGYKIQSSRKSIKSSTQFPADNDEFARLVEQTLDEVGVWARDGVYYNSRTGLFEVDIKGDWKHDHMCADHTLFNKLGMKCVDKREIGESDSDDYEAIHYYKRNEFGEELISKGMDLEAMSVLFQSKKPIKSSKSVCIGFNNDTGALLWKDGDLYTLQGAWTLQTKRKDIADKWIDKYNLNTTDEKRLDRITQEGMGLVPWGLPLVEDKDQTNWNKKLADMILPPRGGNTNKPVYKRSSNRAWRESEEDKERKHELIADIYGKVKTTVKIADPNGKGVWKIFPQNEQIYVQYGNGRKKILEQLPIEDIEYIDSFKSLGLRTSSYNTIKSSREPTKKDYEAFTKQLNNYCKIHFDEYADLYDFECMPDEFHKGFIIVDNEGNLDMHSDEQLTKYIRDELSKKGWYPEATYSSSDFSIATM